MAVDDRPQRCDSSSVTTATGQYGSRLSNRDGFEGLGETQTRTLTAADVRGLLPRGWNNTLGHATAEICGTRCRRRQLKAQAIYEGPRKSRALQIDALVVRRRSTLTMRRS